MKAKIISHLIAVSVFLTLAPQLSADDAPDSHHKPSTKAWKSDREQGKKAAEKNDYAQAEQFYKAAVADARNFGAKDDRLADSLMDLGLLYSSTRHFTQAEPVFRELVTIRRGDPNPVLEADALANYGSVLRVNHNFAEALTTYQRLGDVLSRKFGGDHPYVAEARLQVAAVYFEKGDYAQAEPLLKKSVETFQHPGSRIIMRETEPANYRMKSYLLRFRPNYVNALQALSMLDVIYVVQNRQAEAAQGLQECFKVIDENSKANDLVVFDTLNRLGRVYLDHSDYAGAESIFSRSMTLCEKNLGETNETTLDAENKLAGVYEQEHKMSEAGALYAKILATNEHAFGVDSSESTAALSKLARFYFDAKEYEQAEPLYARERRHIEKFLGLDLALNPILADQVMIYTKLGKDEELAGVYQQQAAVFEKMFGANSRAVVKPLTNEAAVLRKLRRDAEAETLEKRVAAIQAPK